MLEADVDDAAALRERATGAGRDPKLGRRRGARAERKLSPAHAEPERTEARTHFHPRRPAQGIEGAGSGVRPRSPGDGRRQTRARTGRQAHAPTDHVGEVGLRRYHTAHARAQPIVGPRPRREPEGTREVEEQTPRKPETVVAHLVGLLQPLVARRIVEPARGRYARGAAQKMDARADVEPGSQPGYGREPQVRDAAVARDIVGVRLGRPS